MAYLAAILIVGELLASRQHTHVPATAEVVQRDLSDRPVKVFPSHAKHGVIVFYVRGDSPEEASYAPTMKAVFTRFSKKGWKVYLDYAGGGLYSPKARIENAKRYGFPFPILQEGGLQNMGQVTVSPECAVFDRRGDLLYHGAIDGGSDRRPQYLAEVVGAITAGKPAPFSYVKAVGKLYPMD
jgi:hypothetical protein